MNYKLALTLRFLTGFLFYSFFFIGSYQFLISGYFSNFYIFSFLTSLVYLYFSYLVSYYNMHYLFEFTKEFILKSILIISMHAFVVFVCLCFPLVLGAGNKGLTILFFGSFYIAFEVISELAIVTTSYRKSVNLELYESKMLFNFQKEEYERSLNPDEYYYQIPKKVGIIEKLISKYLFVTVSNCFVNHNNECYGVYDKAFYMKLLEMSLENQRFFDIKLQDNKNYIVDCRGNKICITNSNFSFIDHYGAKCIITKNFSKELI